MVESNCLEHELDVDVQLRGIESYIAIFVHMSLHELHKFNMPRKGAVTLVELWQVPCLV
jgi:hypothetical protein